MRSDSLPIKERLPTVLESPEHDIIDLNSDLIASIEILNLRLIVELR